MPPTFRSLDSALQRCAKQEPGGLEQVYQQVAPAIQALAQSVLENELQARQVLHETMVLVWQHAHQYNAVYGPSHAWIFSIFRYRLQALQRQTVSKQSARIASAQHWLSKTEPWLDHFEPPLRAYLNEEMAQAIALAYCKGLNGNDIAMVSGIETQVLLSELSNTLSAVPSETDSKSQTNAPVAMYVLGLLDGQQMATTQSAIAQDDNALKQALYWEAIFSRLTQHLPTPSPDEETWEKIQKTLNLTIIPQPLKTPEKVSRPTTPATAPARQARQARPASAAPEAADTHTPTRKRHKWRILATALFALLTTAAVYIWLVPITPELTSHSATENNENFAPEPLSLHTVVLQPPGSTSTPGWLIVSREPGVLYLEPLLKSQLADNESLVLWRRKPNSPAIQKLGVVNDTAPSQIRLTSGFSVVEPMLYEITIERNPADLSEPEGDVAFIGQSLRLKVPDPEPEAPVTPAQ